MTILEGFWLLALILVSGILLIQLTCWLAGLAERLVWWVMRHAKDR